MSFDADAFVASCHDALADIDPVGAVAQLVDQAVSEHGRTIGARIETLHASPRLTVQVIAWPVGAQTDPHEHNMWAVVGVFDGEETNRFYSAGADGRLVPSGSRVVGVGDVLSLDEAAVHDAASTGPTGLCALHVYGGDLFGVDRRAWNPAGIPGPYEEVVAGRRLMLQALGAYERNMNTPLTSEQRRRAMAALWDAAAGAGRYLDPDESLAAVKIAIGRI